MLHRVHALADRTVSDIPQQVIPYTCLIPLKEILAEINNVGPQSKKVTHEYMKCITAIGNELSILETVPLQDIEKAGFSQLAEAISRMRDNNVIKQPGYDGVYGIITVYPPSPKKISKRMQAAATLDKKTPKDQDTQLSFME